MKRRLITLAVAAAVGGATAVPLASADDGKPVVSSSQRVSAFFTSTSGCITTQASIRANRDGTRSGGTRTTRTTATIELNRFDTCAGGLPLTPFFREDSIVIPDAALDIDDSLGFARLSTTLPLQEQNTGEFRNVTLRVVWLGTGSKDSTRTVSRSDGTRTVSEVASRSAVAFGFAGDGTTSFISGPSTDASLFSASTRVGPIDGD